MSQNSPEKTPQRWYEGGLPFACTACGNCCKSNGEYSHVYLRQEEVGAIADYLGLDPVLFLREHLVVEDGWISLQPDRPECQFLTGEGRCGIYPVRPVQCRTWPFWEINLVEETWRQEVNKICPGSRDGARAEAHTPERVERIAHATEDWYEGRLKEWPGTSHEL